MTALKDGDKIKCLKGHTVCQVVDARMLTSPNRWGEAFGKWRYAEPKIGGEFYCGMCGAEVRWPPRPKIQEPKPVTLVGAYPQSAGQPGSCPPSSLGVPRTAWKEFELPVHAVLPHAPDLVIAAVCPDYKFYDDSAGFAAFAVYADRDPMLQKMGALLIGAWKGLHGTRKRLIDVVRRDCQRLQVDTLMVEHGNGDQEFARALCTPSVPWNIRVPPMPMPIADKVDTALKLFEDGRVFVPVSKAPNQPADRLFPRDWAHHAMSACVNPDPHGLLGHAILDCLGWIRVQHIIGQLRARNAAGK